MKKRKLVVVGEMVGDDGKPFPLVCIEREDDMAKGVTPPPVSDVQARKQMKIILHAFDESPNIGRIRKVIGRGIAKIAEVEGGACGLKFSVQETESGLEITMLDGQRADIIHNDNTAKGGMVFTLSPPSTRGKR